MPKALRKTRKSTATKSTSSKVAAKRRKSKKPRQPTTPVSRQRAGRVASPLPAAALKPERIRQILERLDERYPNVTCALNHQSAWELLAATILSAQCTDATANKVPPELFNKYPPPAAFASLQPEELEPDIRPTGFFRNKSKSLFGPAKSVIQDSDGHVPN